MTGSPAITADARHNMSKYMQHGCNDYATALLKIRRNGHVNSIHFRSYVYSLDCDLPKECWIRRGADRGTFEIVFDFKLLMRKRGSDTVYVQEGYVQKSTDRQLMGAVECGGGGFTLDKVPSGIPLSPGDLGIRMPVVPDPCGESDRANNSTYIERGKDDGTFPLERDEIRLGHIRHWRSSLRTRLV
jgi:hypothetical protein